MGLCCNHVSANPGGLCLDQCCCGLDAGGGGGPGLRFGSRQTGWSGRGVLTPCISRQRAIEAIRVHSRAYVRLRCDHYVL